jgi:HPt (histidine-containing phosphotransfer) domain-containing protein
LNNILNKFIRDKYPEESKNYKPITSMTETSKIHPKVLKIFCKDAEKAIHSLRKIITVDDLKSFTTTVHAMKSALANVGEFSASSQAKALEAAGQKIDINYISDNVNVFVETLEDLIKKFSIPAPAEENLTISEDYDFLNEQLHIIKTACEKYNARTAYAALDRLKEYHWEEKTSAALEQIYDLLFLYSDFEEAAEKVEELL